MRDEFKIFVINQNKILKLLIEIKGIEIIWILKRTKNKF